MDLNLRADLFLLLLVPPFPLFRNTYLRPLEADGSLHRGGGTAYLL